MKFNLGAAVFAVFALLGAALLAYFASTNVFSPWMVGFMVMGFMLAMVDSTMGGGYGTVGTPLLILFGFATKLATPSILISQGIACSFATVFHHKYKNVDLRDLKGEDTKIAAVIVALGLIGAAIGVATALSLPKIYLNTYIGLLVLAIGMMMVVNAKYKFSWKKIMGIGLITGFNKALSGGAYGPVVTGGQVVSGRDIRRAVGVSIFTVIPITIFSLFLYLSSHTITNVYLPIFLTIGAVVATGIGPKITSHMNKDIHHRMFGVVIALLGILTIIPTFIK